MANNTKIASHCDALGDTIIIGKKYGWSINNHGFTHVITGIAEKFTEKGVTLKVLSSIRCLYDYDPEPIKVKEKINIRGICIFPIDKPNINLYV
jgi:hypothetical protein